MAKNFILNTAGRNAAMDAITALLNAGGAGTINIYDGTQPATPATAITTQNLLVTLTFSATAFTASVNGTAAANSITAGTAVATGTATWARLKSGAGSVVADCSVGTSSADLILPTVAISTGNTVSISAGSLTHPQ